jgi:hypothetical protein
MARSSQTRASLQPPVAHHGVVGDAQSFGRFLHAESAEIAHFDHLRAARFGGGEGGQQLIELHQVGAPGHALSRQIRRRGQRDALTVASPALGPARTGKIDQHPPHQLRGHGQEMHAVPPMDAAGVDQAQVSFVDERGRFERMSLRLAPHVTMGQTAQFGINEWDEFVERGSFPAAPRQEKLRDFPKSGLTHPGILTRARAKHPL